MIIGEKLTNKNGGIYGTVWEYDGGNQPEVEGTWKFALDIP